MVLIHELEGLEGLNLSENSKEAVSYLKAEITSKIESMKAREVFTEYKSAPIDSDEREEARRNYLEIQRMHKYWVSEREIKSNPSE
jgi:hypothetical protein